MKVLLSAYGCNPYRGSEPGYGWNWAYHIAELGHEVYCLTSTWGKEDIEKKLKEVSIPNLHFIFIEVPEYVKKLYRYQAGVYYHYLVWQKRASKKAKELDRAHQFDLIHHVTYGSPQLGSGMWRLNKTFVYGPLGGGQTAPISFKPYFYGWWRQEISRDWMSWLLMSFNRNSKMALKKSDLVLVSNQETKHLTQQAGARNVELFLDASLPPEFFPQSLPQRNGTEQKPLRLLWVGRLFARKGLPLVLESLSKVSPDVPFQMTIVGDGPMGEMLPGIIKQHGIEDKVNWVGRIPWEEVKEAYLNHDVFMFCSLRESFGSQLLEAMAYGLPIITLNHQGARDFVPDEAAIKVEVTHPDETLEAMRKAVEWMYHHSQGRKAMGEAGFNFALTQTWPLKVKEVVARYSTLTTT